MIDVFRRAECWNSIGGGWCGEFDAENGADEGWRAWAVVAVEAAGALEQEINGGVIADHDIKVKIETLFDDLGGNEDAAGGSRAGGAKRAETLALDGVAIAGAKACVEE